jgi:hypothetical protein
MIEWLQKWYTDRCDEDWEHMYGIQIGNIDNPGWAVTIDLADTELADFEKSYETFENSEEDWYAYSIENKVFKGVGDPGKLNKIIETFKEIWESKLKG